MKNRLTALLLFILLLPVIGCGQSSDLPSMTVKELKQHMQNDSTLVILDVRTPSELTGPLGKIDSVINIPVQVLAERMNELNKYKDQPIAVICRSGNRSARATRMLIEDGFKATNVLGGMKAWNAEENKEK